MNNAYTVIHVCMIYNHNIIPIAHSFLRCAFAMESQVEQEFAVLLVITTSVTSIIDNRGGRRDWKRAYTSIVTSWNKLVMLDTPPLARLYMLA